MTTARIILGTSYTTYSITTAQNAIIVKWEPNRYEKREVQVPRYWGVTGGKKATSALTELSEAINVATIAEEGADYDYWKEEWGDEAATDEQNKETWRAQQETKRAIRAIFGEDEDLNELLNEANKILANIHMALEDAKNAE